MYLVIEGVIGVGKTTLARMLQPRFDSALLLEVFEENPFLSKFYADRERYAFQTQMFFLLSRYHQQRRGIPSLSAGGRNLIGDYTFEKDALFAQINLRGDELDMYYRVHEALAEKIPVPDLVIYLRANEDLLLERIERRGRPYERNMDPVYIGELAAAYDNFYLHSARPMPVLTISAADHDFVAEPEQINWIRDQICEMLSLAPVQPVLPLGLPASA